MPVASLRFITESSCSRPAAITLSLASLEAVFFAAYRVKEMNLDRLRWLVLGVVVCAAALMLRSAFAGRTRPVPIQVDSPA